MANARLLVLFAASEFVLFPIPIIVFARAHAPNAGAVR